MKSISVVLLAPLALPGGDSPCIEVKAPDEAIT
jgi:hypothetical protein